MFTVQNKLRSDKALRRLQLNNHRGKLLILGTVSGAEDGVPFPVLFKSVLILVLFALLPEGHLPSSNTEHSQKLSYVNICANKKGFFFSFWFNWCRKLSYQHWAQRPVLAYSHLWQPVLWEWHPPLAFLPLWKSPEMFSSDMVERNTWKHVGSGTFPSHSSWIRPHFMESVGISHQILRDEGQPRGYSHVVHL